MTPDDFRKLALAIPGAIESAHNNHPDFRIGGKVFASLGAPDIGWGMVKLTTEEQVKFIEKGADAFRPANGAWGKSGYTIIFLRSAEKDVVHSAIEAAAKNVLMRPTKKTVTVAKTKTLRRPSS